MSDVIPSNLVSRMRAAVADEYYKPRLMTEAADEIERLQKLIRRVVEWEPVFPVECTLLDELNAAANAPPTPVSSKGRSPENCDYPDCEQHWTYVATEQRKLLGEARAYVLSFAAITKHPTAPADAHDLVKRMDVWIKNSPPAVDFKAAPPPETKAEPGPFVWCILPVGRVTVKSEADFWGDTAKRSGDERYVTGKAGHYWSCPGCYYMNDANIRFNRCGGCGKHLPGSPVRSSGEPIGDQPGATASDSPSTSEPNATS